MSQNLQARTIRQEIEKKLPDDVLCQNQQQKESDVDMMAIRHKAETILNDLAKHLVALKSSEGRLNQEARKSYLQVSDNVSNISFFSFLVQRSHHQYYTLNNLTKTFSGSSRSICFTKRSKSDSNDEKSIT
jgi:hypothetical protein